MGKGNSTDRQALSLDKKYKLLGPDGELYLSDIPGEFGGHLGNRIFGRLDCPVALSWIARGHYLKQRVFFKDEEAAIKAGFRPCGKCLPEKYKSWKLNSA